MNYVTNQAKALIFVLLLTKGTCLITKICNSSHFDICFELKKQPISSYYFFIILLTAKSFDTIVIQESGLLDLSSY